MACYCYVSISAEDKILIFEMDTSSGDLNLLDEVESSGAPGPLATNPSQQQLYVSRRKVNRTSSLNIDRSTGSLSKTGEISMEADPCFLYVDPTGQNLLSASYGGAVAGSHRIREDGTLAESPTSWISTAPKAHCIQTDPSNTFAFVPHVGESNAIFQFRFDPDSGELSPNDVPSVSPPKGTGPRHFDFHPKLNVVYVSNEQGNSVSAYRFDPQTGTLSLFQTLSTLPDGFSEENTCAQIHIVPSGRHVYVSNRGHESIVGFEIDPESGELTSLGHEPTEPPPRAFNIDPAGNFLYAGGQASGKLASYRILESGRLQPLRTYDVGKESMWVLFVQ